MAKERLGQCVVSFLWDHATNELIVETFPLLGDAVCRSEDERGTLPAANADLCGNTVEIAMGEFFKTDAKDYAGANVSKWRRAASRPKRI